jgi:hypothetical protein
MFNALGARLALPHDRVRLKWIDDQELTLQHFRFHFRDVWKRITISTVILNGALNPDYEGKRSHCLKIKLAGKQGSALYSIVAKYKKFAKCSNLTF